MWSALKLLKLIYEMLVNLQPGISVYSFANLYNFMAPFAGIFAFAYQPRGFITVKQQWKTCSTPHGSALQRTTHKSTHWMRWFDDTSGSIQNISLTHSQIDILSLRS